MLDIGWSEMGVIALVALLVMGPKELPNALRTFAHWMRQARSLAREFQSGVDQIVREAELEEAKKALQSASRMNVNKVIENSIDPDREITRALEVNPATVQATPAIGSTAQPPSPAIDAAAAVTGPAGVVNGAAAVAPPAPEPEAVADSAAAEPAAAVPADKTTHA
jgi:sec-independent protein translocase protein TatB